MYDIAISNEQTQHTVNEDRLRSAMRNVLEGEGICSAAVSIAVVDDATIRRLNREFLKHDYPTDVLSFVLDAGDGRLEGEVIVSVDSAAASADDFDWRIDDELLLCVIHGTLHLVGYDDQTSASLAEMRSRERQYLSHFGLSPRYEGMAPGARA